MDLAGIAAMIMMSDSSVEITDRLKIIDDAPALAKIDIGDSGWSMVVKKIDALNRRDFQTSRDNSDSAEWKTAETNIYTPFTLCIYKGTSIKWVPRCNDTIESKNDKYKWSLVSNGDHVYHKYQQIISGTAVGDDPDIDFKPDVIQIGSIQTYFPSSSSTYISPQLYVSCIYDQKTINYDTDGTIVSTTYNRNLQKSFILTALFNIEDAADPSNLQNDIADFCIAVYNFVTGG